MKLVALLLEVVPDCFCLSLIVVKAHINNDNINVKNICMPRAGPNQSILGGCTEIFGGLLLIL